jgi:hypothetical protein
LIEARREGLGSLRRAGLGPSTSIGGGASGGYIRSCCLRHFMYSSRSSRWRSASMC